MTRIQINFANIRKTIDNVINGNNLRIFVDSARFASRKLILVTNFPIDLLHSVLERIINSSIDHIASDAVLRISTFLSNEQSFMNRPIGKTMSVYAFRNN